MPPSAPLISLTSQGLYCAVGGFHIDPWEPVPKAIVTHAHGDHLHAGSGEYYTAAPGVPLLGVRLPAGSAVTPLAYGETRVFGEARVSLHPAGHILGSSQVRVEAGGEVWVFSGDYKRDPDPTCAPFEVVPCDVFITEATFATPIYRWASGAEVARDILAWWQGCAARGTTAVLFCYALGKAQRVLAELGRLGDLPAESIILHGALLGLTEAYRSAGIAMPPTEHLTDAFTKADLAGRLVLAPPSAYRSPWMRRFKAFETGFASGWVRVRGALRQRGHDRGFVLSDHADWPGLVRTIRETGARRVLATHGRTDLLVRWLQTQGIDAAPLRTSFGDEEGNG